MASHGFLIMIIGVLCGLLSWYWNENESFEIYGSFEHKIISFLGRVLPLCGLVIMVIGLYRYLYLLETSMCKELIMFKKE